MSLCDEIFRLNGKVNYTLSVCAIILKSEGLD